MNDNRDEMTSGPEREVDGPSISDAATRRPNLALMRSACTR
jgi:hypothetical protein